MKTFFHIFSFESKVLWRSSMLKVLLLVILGTGVYGIFFGKFEIDKQEARISEVEQYERQQFDSLLVWVRLDTTIDGNKEKYQNAVSPTGAGWSKHFTYYLSDETPSAAGLCLGQRDLFPVYYGFNVTDLARQTNVGELANPMKLLTGNFDLSYVFVFLFPLLVVALFYNLFANEKEGGTLPLLLSQTASLRTILLSKGFLRLLIIWALATVLLVLGFIIQGISFAANSHLFFAWLLTVYGYCLLWTLIMSIIVWMRLSGALSAMVGLGVWLIFTLVTPALLNLFVKVNEPLPNRSEMIHAVRNLNDQIWGNPKTFVLDDFYNENPQYDQGDTLNFNKWYYAGFTLVDKEASALKAQFEEKIASRNGLSEKWVWIAPAAWMHEKLSELSATDRQSHQVFVREMYDYHQQLKKIYYARIFSEDEFSVEDLEKLRSTL